MGKKVLPDGMDLFRLAFHNLFYCKGLGVCRVLVPFALLKRFCYLVDKLGVLKDYDFSENQRCLSARFR